MNDSQRWVENGSWIVPLRLIEMRGGKLGRGHQDGLSAPGITGACYATELALLGFRDDMFVRFSPKMTDSKVLVCTPNQNHESRSEP